jgi:ATP-dependent Lhr-like helicase
LIQVATGAGKTYAAFLGALAEMIDLGVGQRGGARGQGLHTLYVTPLRAVTRDIELALKRPIEEMGLPMVVESRTGDTSAKVRALQRGRLPHVLLTTPESLCLLLTRENARELFAGLSCVIVDEWHDLLTSKRGSATELALARLRAWNPGMRTWGMSATIPNAGEALATLVGEERSPRRATESHGDGKEASGELGTPRVGGGWGVWGWGGGVGVVRFQHRDTEMGRKRRRGRARDWKMLSRGAGRLWFVVGCGARLGLRV